MSDLYGLVMLAIYVLGCYLVGVAAARDFDQERVLVRRPWMILVAAYLWPLTALPLLWATRTNS